jgi:hypothetical protein
MQKLKPYLIIVLIVIFTLICGTVKYQFNIIRNRNAEIARLLDNELQLLAENLQITNLNLKNSEVTGKLKKERDSLAIILKINPKQIQKIITIDNSIHDTIKVPIPVSILSKNEWLLRDSSKCFKYVSKLVLEGDSIKATRLLYESDNTTVQTFYKKRPYKVWFIRYGKWLYLQKINSDCGDVKFHSFTFLKE